MLSPEFTIQDDFPAVGYDQWRALVDESLKGASFDRKLVTHSHEGIDIQPLYSRRDELGRRDPFGFPGLAPFVRGSQPLGAVATGWDLRQEYSHPDLAVTHREILDDLAGGVSSLLLRLDDCACRGLDPDQNQNQNQNQNQDPATELRGSYGIMAYRADDFDAILATVPLGEVGIALDAGAAFLPAAAALASVWRRHDVAPDRVHGAFNSDPLAALARHGQLPQSAESALSALADVACWTTRHYPHVTAVGVDTSPYHDAGATAAQDLALSIATAVEYLRAMTRAGLDIDAAARQILFRIGLGTHHFLAIAKLRAARGLWSRVAQTCGASGDAGAMRIHARTSNRVLTRRDPYVNLLRNTVAAFAAAVGGAEVITSVPFDAMVGLPDNFSRRVARNTVLILREEAHLQRVVDPAGGSWYLDQLTDQLAEKAWAVFQDIERQGGMLSAIQSGWVAQQIDTAYAPRADDIARRSEGITGVSEFPDIGEQPVTRSAPDGNALRADARRRVAATRTDHDVLRQLPSASNRMAVAVEAATAGATMGQLADALGFHTDPSDPLPPLELNSFAKPFETLRDASDAWQVVHGHRPRVFLANMGPVAHHTARAAYSKNFFEAGGFEVIGNDGFDNAEDAAEAFSRAGAKIAVVCSSDELYPNFVPQVTPRLKAAGARSVVLAGHPRDRQSEWQSAGIDRFIFVSCNVLETLREMLGEEGVLQSDEE